MSPISSHRFRYFFTLEYDGKDFCGWQRQKGLRSVQSVFEEALYQVTNEKHLAYAAGRTDAGVHALGQVVHVTFNQLFSLDRLRRGTNFYLKNAGLVVKGVSPVSLQSHARFSARARVYTYYILNSPSPSVLNQQRSWWIPRCLNVERMQEAGHLLLGTHDFSAFRSASCQAKSASKTLDILRFEKCEDCISCTLQARSFLHNQVRIIIGTLVKIGDASWQPSYTQQLLETGDRRLSGPLAPPHGLYLTSVIYRSEEGMMSCKVRTIF